MLGPQIPEQYSCEKVRQYEIELALLLNKLNQIPKQSESYLNKCGLLLEKEFERLLNITAQQQQSEQSFKQYLNEVEIAESRIDELLIIHRKVKQTLLIQELFRSIEEFLVIDISEKSHAEKYLASKNFRDKIESYPNGFFKKLAEILLAIKIDNEAWATTRLLEFFNYHPARIGFDLYRQVFDHGWTLERHNKLILNISLEITRYFKNKRPEEMDIFMTLMEQAIDSRVFATLSQKYGKDWSLARLREAVARGERARQYPSFWYSQLSYRTSSGQVDQFLRNLFTESKRYPIAPDALWIFSENFPRLEQERLHLTQIALGIPSEEFYFHYLVIELIENEAFKKIMEDKSANFKRPTFQLKRQLYRQGLESLKAPEWMLYELLKLGDFQKDYLWYLGLHPNFRQPKKEETEDENL